MGKWGQKAILPGLPNLEICALPHCTPLHSLHNYTLLIKDVHSIWRESTLGSSFTFHTVPGYHSVHVYHSLITAKRVHSDVSLEYHRVESSNKNQIQPKQESIYSFLFWFILWPYLEVLCTLDSLLVGLWGPYGMTWISLGLPCIRQTSYLLHYNWINSSGIHF